MIDKLPLTKSREANDESESESPSEEEVESQEESSDEEDDAGPAVPVRSYAALMQSLSAESAPQVKRRKLEHTSNPKAEEIGVTERVADAEAVAEETDLVEEEEEGPETATDGLLEDEDQDEPEDASDPFEAHFADPDDNLLGKRLRSLQQNEWTSQKAALLKVGKAVISVPQKEDTKGSNGSTPVSGPEELKLKQKLAGAMLKQLPSFDALEKSIAQYIFGYQDVLFCERSPSNSASLRRLTCLHAINHVFKLVLNPTDSLPILTNAGPETV
jgi:U3 small nucleolar RNA-associated protein 25